MYFLIFGPPGAGKGTQAKIIAKEFNLLHLSSGDLLRQAIKEKKLGAEINKLLNSGKLAPNKIVNPLITETISNFSINKKYRGMIIDGYPRNLSQVKFLDKLLNKKNTRVTALINLKLSYVDAISRILLRAQSSNRNDDNLESVTQRLRIYKKETKPILDYYRQQKKLINLDGTLNIKEVSQLITASLQKFFK